MAILFLLAVFGFVFVAKAQIQSSDKQSMQLLEELQTKTDNFRVSLNKDLNQIKNAELKNAFSARIDALELAAELLRKRAGENNIAKSDVENVLSRGLLIEMQIRGNHTLPRALSDWMLVRNTLDLLARTHRIAWVWKINQNPYWQRASKSRVLERLEACTGKFRVSFDRALEKISRKEGNYAGIAGNYLKSFEEDISKMRDQSLGGTNASVADVEQLLVKAVSIDNIIKNRKFAAEVKRDWAQVKVNLDELAYLNNIFWRWIVKPKLPF